jgi:hypothetical protein
MDAGQRDMLEVALISSGDRYPLTLVDMVFSGLRNTLAMVVQLAHADDPYIAFGLTRDSVGRLVVTQPAEGLTDMLA